MYKQLILTELVKEAGRKSNVVFPRKSVLSAVHDNKYSVGKPDIFGSVTTKQDKNVQKRFDRDMFMHDHPNTLDNSLFSGFSGHGFGGELATPPSISPHRMIYTQPMMELSRIRKINLDLKGKLPNKVRKQITSPMMKKLFSDVEYTRDVTNNTSSKKTRYAEKYLNANKSVLDDWDMLFNPIGRKGLKNLQDNIQAAKNVEVMQHIASNYSHPASRDIMGRIVFKHDAGTSDNAHYGGYNHDIGLGSNLLKNIYTLGHEEGHAANNTRPKPSTLIGMSAIGVDDQIANTIFSKNKFLKRFPDPKQRAIVAEIFEEIEANRQIHKMMRGALKGNPKLYRRFKKNYELSTIPSLATYADGHRKELTDAVQYLPPSLQRSAKKYLKKYKQFESKALDRYFGNDPSEHLLSLVTGRFPDDRYNAIFDEVKRYKNYVQRKDPNFANDLYNYMITKGMKPNMNMWWRNPYMNNVNEKTKGVDILFNTYGNNVAGVNSIKDDPILNKYLTNINNNWVPRR